jgi:hypothetical protein
MKIPVIIKGFINECALEDEIFQQVETLNKYMYNNNKLNQNLNHLFFHQVHPPSPHHTHT